MEFFFNKLVDTGISIISALLILLVIWLASKVVMTRLANSVRGEVEKDIEKAKSDLRKEEEESKKELQEKIEQYRAELRQKESDIAAIRSGVLNVIGQRQMQVFSKRLIAIEQLFESVYELQKLGAQIAKSAFEYRAALKSDRTEETVEGFYKTIINILSSQNIDLSAAEKARPYLPSDVWSVYIAMITVKLDHFLLTTTQGITSFDQLDRTEFLEKISNELILAKNINIDTHSLTHSGVYQKLEDFLYDCTQKIINGGYDDQQHLFDAAEIIKISKDLFEKIQLKESLHTTD